MIVDCFAGPGGWSVALAQLGRQDIGIEWDAATCTTRRAAGHLTVRADVASYPLAHLAGKVEGLIMSPPCQSFSAAGKRDGVASESGNLIFEVPRWVEAIWPMWVACEQVPEVLPYWKMFAERFRALGYSTWAGVLCAADFSVPQTRHRAILMAHRGRQVHPPAPTHAEHPEDGFFGSALLPWVTMAEALSWGYPARPAPTVTGGGTKSGGAEPFGNGARTGLEAVVGYHRHRSPAYGDRRVHPADGPAPVITGNARSDRLIVKGTAAQHRTERTVDRPALALAFGHNAAGWGWVRTGQRSGGDYEGTEPVKLTVAEALILQDFDPSYPVQGSRTAQFAQIGNAIPVGFARAILDQLVSR